MNDVMYRIILMWGPLDGQYRMISQELFDLGRLTFKTPARSWLENDAFPKGDVTNHVYEMSRPSREPETWEWRYVPPMD